MIYIYIERLKEINQKIKWFFVRLFCKNVMDGGWIRCDLCPTKSRFLGKEIDGYESCRSEICPKLKKGERR